MEERREEEEEPLPCPSLVGRGVDTVAIEHTALSINIRISGILFFILTLVLLFLNPPRILEVAGDPFGVNADVGRTLFVADPVVQELLAAAVADDGAEDLEVLVDGGGVGFDATLELDDTALLLAALVNHGEGFRHLADFESFNDTGNLGRQLTHLET